ncbi:TetR/AcrR family transcriptional regulator [Nocardia nova]|nr:TetR/AcrR family transcriptional regulator [Nocardia nova]
MTSGHTGRPALTYRQTQEGGRVPTSTWARLPEARRSAVPCAAQDEFCAHGYSGASLNTICRNAGVSKGSLFQYFDDKADLYAHLTELSGERVQAAMNEPMHTAALNLTTLTAPCSALSCRLVRRRRWPRSRFPCGTAPRPWEIRWCRRMIRAGHQPRPCVA